MAKAGAIRFGRAFVELFADNTLLVRGLRRAEKKLKAFGDSIRNFGLKIAGAVSAVTAPLAALSIKAASDAQESLSRFEAVFKDQAKAAGQFADALAHSVGRSKIEIRDALATFQSFFVGLGFSGEAARDLSQTMQSLALDFASFHNLSDDEAIGRFISALSGSSEVLDRFGINIKQAALEQELLAMGVRKSWTEVTEQEKALARLNIIARAMGDQGAIGDAVKTAGSFTNQMKRLRGLLRDTSESIGQALLPVVTPLVQKAAEMVRWLGEWISRNQQLVATMFKVAAVVIAGGLALAALGTVISGLGSALGVLATIVTSVGTVFKLLGAAIALLAKPIVIAIAAVAALGVYLLYATGVGAKALEWLGSRFGQLKDDALDAYQGIADALAAGDIALAARVLWLTLKMEWTRGVNFLEKIWLNFRNFFVRLAYDAFDGALAAAVSVWHALESGWIETTAFLSKVWNRFTSFFARTWEKMKAIATKAALWIMKQFDDSINLEAAYSIVEEEKGKAISRIDQKQQAQQADIERQRQSRRESAATMRDAMLEQIAKQNVERYRALDESYAERMRQNANDLDEARRAWQQSLQDARQKRFAAEEGPERLKAPGKLALPEIPLLGEQFDKQAARITAAGGFSGFLRFGVEGQSAAERTANGVEQIVKNTRDLLELERDNQEAIV